METKLNIAEILKNKPVGTKLYSPLFGDVYLFYVKNGIINVQHHGGITKFFDNGRYYNYPESEPLLFPSKEMRDWSKFAWKKGDVLVSREGSKILFDKWASEDYTKFLGKIKVLGNSHCYDTAYYTLASKEEALEFIKSVEEINNGNLNRETLEIEKTLSEFKDGDIVTQGVLEGVNVYIIKNCIDKIDNKYNYYARYNTQNKKIIYDDWSHISPFTKFATDSEKQQLFDALAKEGKAWDAEKKQIVDLKPKVELKPFDKVLVRDSKSDYWRATLFSHINENGCYCYMWASWSYCIPYEGNESLLGTTKDVEG